ncbi:hypothetical protein KBA27_05435 [bacterium]|nr:hypothetical protein [bacterium]
MFEKFTENAINVVTEAQNLAKTMNNAYVQPEHLLLAIVKLSKGIPLKLFRMYNVEYDKLQKVVEEKLKFEKADKPLEVVPFSDSFKTLLKKTLDFANNSGNDYVLFENLFLSVLYDTNSYNIRILKSFNFNFDNSKTILKKLVQKKTKKMQHPESEDSGDNGSSSFSADCLFEDEGVSKIFENAVSKLSASNYEILGTEQILSSILDDSNSDLSKILEKCGLTSEKFEEMLAKQSSRKSEYDGKQIIFTPNAFVAMNTALQVAKELGASDVKPEHLILGILKTQKGVAFDVLKQIHVDTEELETEIIKPIEKEMPEALTILKLARQEARRLGRNEIGTEMILLGIINEGMGIGFKVLNELDINIRDTRQTVENILGFGNEYYDTEVVFTKRAKRVLETAWQTAKKYHKSGIFSEHLLYAITKEPQCVAMKALERLGADVVEIKQGILKEIEGS